MRPTARLFALLLLLAALAAPLRTSAQDTANPFADLGLPEIAITVTDTAFDGAPSELEAGRYVLSVTNSSSSEEDAGVGFVQAPEGMTAAELIGFMASLSATPEAADGEAAPAEEEGGTGAPSWYYETEIAGGVYAPAGETAYAVIDLSAGEWMLWGDLPEAPQAPVPVIVTGEAPADQPTPAADVTIAMQEMSFSVDGSLTAGPQTIALTNAGQQPHFLLMIGVPEGTTPEDFLALSAAFAGDPTASPPAGLSFEELTTGIESTDLSSGGTVWLHADLAAGTYVLACFFPDQETGAPHAFLGMVDVVTVS
jgi:hypothetical protein